MPKPGASGPASSPRAQPRAKFTITFVPCGRKWREGRVCHHLLFAIDVPGLEIYSFQFQRRSNISFSFSKIRDGRRVVNKFVPLPAPRSPRVNSAPVPMSRPWWIPCSSSSRVPTEGLFPLSVEPSEPVESQVDRCIPPPREGVDPPRKLSESVGRFPRVFSDRSFHLPMLPSVFVRPKFSCDFFLQMYFWVCCQGVGGNFYRAEIR